MNNRAALKRRPSDLPPQPICSKPWTQVLRKRYVSRHGKVHRRVRSALMDNRMYYNDAELLTGTIGGEEGST
jgi:hypothetical protein